MNIKTNKIISIVLITLTIKAFEVTDFGQLYPIKVKEFAYPTIIEAIKNIIKNTQKNNKKNIYSRVRHSQARHSNPSNSININIKKFNKVISLDPKNKV